MPVLLFHFWSCLARAVKAKKKFVLFIGLPLIIFLTSTFLLALLHPGYHFQTPKIPILVKPDTSRTGQIAGPVSGGQHDGSFNMLILGIDTWSKDESRADMIMVMNIDPKAKKVNVISIPRDTRVETTGIGYTKINHTHLLGEKAGGNSTGTQATLKAVSNLLQCSIHFYIKVNFRGFEDFVDSVGGLDITLDQPVKLTFAHMTLPAGEGHVDGEVALELTRERFSLKNGDFERQKNQLIVLKALGHKLLGPRYFNKIFTLIQQIRTNVVDTNLKDADVLSLAWLFKQISNEDINYFQIPGTAAYIFDPLVKTKVYFWIPDVEKVKRIREKYFQ